MNDPSMREYLILDNRRPQATLSQKGHGGEWRYLSIYEGADVPLKAIGLHLSLAQLYDGVTLDPDPAGQ